MHYIRRPDWALPERAVTPESVFWNRRAVIAALTGAAATIAGPAAAALNAGEPFEPKPAPNPGYRDAGRPVTPEEISGRYNNFYEFGSHKEIYKRAQDLVSDPWTLTVDGMVEQPFQIGVEDLIAKMPIEERIYRHRCVERWSMVAPWVGFGLAEFVKLAKPTSDAKYLRFETLHDPAMMPGQKQHWYPWPYVEGVTIEEATNELPLMVVGAYGKILPKQFGAPLRLHLPWKYGFKSVKSISRVTFTDKRPVSFWEELLGNEYGFWANVNPEVDHPRWSQAIEQDIGTGEKFPTTIFNGYGAQVAHLYDGLEAVEGDRVWR